MNIKIQRIPLLSPIQKLLGVEKFPTPQLWTDSTVEANDPRLLAIKLCKDDDKSRAIQKFSYLNLLAFPFWSWSRFLLKGPL